MKRLIPIVLVSFAVLGCEDKKAPVTPAPKGPASSTPTSTPAPAPMPDAAPKSGGLPTLPGASDASKAIGDMAAGAKDKVVAGYQTAMDAAKTKIDSLVAKVKDAPEDKKPAMQTTVDGLQAQFANVQQKFTEFKSSTGADWQKLSGDLRSAMDTLNTSLSDAMAKFK